MEVNKIYNGNIAIKQNLVHSLKSTLINYKRKKKMKIYLIKHKGAMSLINIFPNKELTLSNKKRFILDIFFIEKKMQKHI